jgi:ATP-dependent RNA helicase RhlE
MSHSKVPDLTQFTDFGLAAPILQALAKAEYTTPTPIQAQAIPHLMEGRDLLGIAQTGTGKTAAFALPLIHRLMADHRRPAPHSARSLILAPTRELASQIAESFRTYAGTAPLTVEVVFGGVSIGKQERAIFRGVDVLVATPGRLLDLIDRGSCRLDRIESLVLDEADQMLDLGFIHALKRIAKLVPAKRQTLLFSATMPKQIASLAEGWLKEPVKVSVAPVATTAERVEQSVYFCDVKTKQALLEHLLVQPNFDRVIVFTRTKHGADRVVKHLDRAGIVAAAIHGNKSQPQRERALAAFRDGEIGVLVATDIAARGIDIDGVSHVVNFDLPNIPESYVHRIGRTARAGAEGSAVSFCAPDERAYLTSIERLIRAPVPKLHLPTGIKERGIQLAAENRREDDEILQPRREHHHAGRPRDGRRGGAPQGGGERDRNGPAKARPQGGRGPRAEGGPRDGARAEQRTGNRPRVDGPADLARRVENAAPQAPRGDARRGPAKPAHGDKPRDGGRPDNRKAEGGRRFDASSDRPRGRGGRPPRRDA